MWLSIKGYWLMLSIEAINTCVLSWTRMQSSPAAKSVVLPGNLRCHWRPGRSTRLSDWIFLIGAKGTQGLWGLDAAPKQNSLILFAFSEKLLRFQQCIWHSRKWLQRMLWTPFYNVLADSYMAVERARSYGCISCAGYGRQVPWRTWAASKIQVLPSDAKRNRIIPLQFIAAWAVFVGCYRRRLPRETCVCASLCMQVVLLTRTEVWWRTSSGSRR